MGIPAKKLSAFLLNLTLALILLGSSASELPLIEECEGTVAPTLNEDELEAFDGRVAGRPILIAYLGKVYDVSKEADGYGPEGSYSIFAGRACTRAVALPSLKLDDVSDHIAAHLLTMEAHTEQRESAFQKQPTIFLGRKRVLGKKLTARDQRFVREVGLGIKTPKEAINGKFVDKKCPFTGNVPIRGRILKGVVKSTKMNRTIIVRRDYLHYLPKYSRYEKRHKNVPAHCSPAFRVNAGDVVTIGQCRPLSKTVRFNLLSIDRTARMATVSSGKAFGKF